MADAWGIDDGYWDVDGQWHDTPPRVRQTLRVAMGGLADSDDPPPRGRPVWFVRHGSAAAIERPADLVLEDGSAVSVDAGLPPDLPLGYHDLHPSDGGPTTRLIVVPDRVAPAPDRLAALAVQLYAARSTTSWGIGDLGDLAALATWIADAGLGALLVSPLHAPLPIDQPQPSPYFASSRCWRSPLHLRIEAVDGYDDADPGLAAIATSARALGADRRIDRAAVWAAKRVALRRAWERARPGGAAFTGWRAAQGAGLHRYAVFCALAEHHGQGWPGWPAEHRRPDAPGVQRFAAEHADDVDFHAWVQFQCDVQHAAASTVAAGVGLVHDLAVGSAPDGADAWMWQDVLALGARVGAPPDEFNRDGQDWGLPPFTPWRLRAHGYEPLAQLLRAAFRHGSGLRVDHVMGLFRLWWIPEGAGPQEGGYVRMPGHELLDILALESARAGCFVVGEDLGTVEDEVRGALGERGVLSYRVAWFEDGPPDTWPRDALAAITTHDLPTIAGVWSGHDDPGGAFAPRLSALVGSPAPTSASEASARAHRRLASAPSRIVSATLDDLVAVEERPNLPGTTTEHPNWSIALPEPLEVLMVDADAREVLRAVAAPD